MPTPKYYQGIYHDFIKSMKFSSQIARIIFLQFYRLKYILLIYCLCLHLLTSSKIEFNWYSALLNQNALISIFLCLLFVCVHGEEHEVLNQNPLDLKAQTGVMEKGLCMKQVREDVGNLKKTAELILVNNISRYIC